jgi:hypothetical protein
LFVIEGECVHNLAVPFGWVVEDELCWLNGEEVFVESLLWGGLLVDGSVLVVGLLWLWLAVVLDERIALLFLLFIFNIELMVILQFQ